MPMTFRIAHLTTVDTSLRYLLMPQLVATRDLGFETIGISAPGPDVGFLESSGIRHIPLDASTRSMSVRSDLKAALQLRRVLRENPVDILHTHNPKPGLYGRLVGRMAGVPIIVNTVHGLYATERDPVVKRSLVYLVEAIASHFSNAELFQSAEDLTLMEKFPLARRSHMTVLGNGIDLKRFRPDRAWESRGKVRAELGLPADVAVVGTVARLVAEKGIPELLEAFRRRSTEYALLIVGAPDPTKADSLNRQHLAEAEREGVRFLGHRHDVEEFYRALDVFVLPSHREGFPRSAMEAAASGVPVIATDIRGCRDVVDDGRNGVLVGVKDPNALARAIENLVNDQDERRRMGAEGRDKAVSEFDEDRVVDRVLDAYRRAAVSKGLMELGEALSGGSSERSRADHP